MIVNHPEDEKVTERIQKGYRKDTERIQKDTERIQRYRKDTKDTERIQKAT